MNIINTVLKSDGMRTTLKDFPGGRIKDGNILFDGGNIVLKHETSLNNPDGFKIAETKKEWLVGSGTVAGMFSGLLNLSDAPRRGRPRTHAPRETSTPIPAFCLP